MQSITAFKLSTLLTIKELNETENQKHTILCDKAHSDGALSLKMKVWAVGGLASTDF